MVCIFGFKDVNYHDHHDETDPYAHLRNYPKFSIRRFGFSDPYYTPDDHEKYMN